MDEFNNKNEVGEDIEYNDASSTNKKVKANIFLKTLEKGKTLLTHVLINKVVKDTKTKKFVAKPHEKSLARSHLQPMSKLPPSINRLAKVNVTKMMIEEKDHKSFFEF